MHTFSVKEQRSNITPDVSGLVETGLKQYSGELDGYFKTLDETGLLDKTTLDILKDTHSECDETLRRFADYIMNTVSVHVLKMVTTIQQGMNSNEQSPLEYDLQFQLDEMSDGRKRVEKQNDVLKDQLNRRNMQLAEQRALYNKELINLREQLFQKERLGKPYQPENMELLNDEFSLGGNDGDMSGDDMKKKMEAVMAKMQQKFNDEKKKLESQLKILERERTTQVRDLEKIRTETEGRLKDQIANMESSHRENMERAESKHEAEVNLLKQQASEKQELLEREKEEALRTQKEMYEQRIQKELGDLQEKVNGLSAKVSTLETAKADLEREVEGWKKELKEEQRKNKQAEDELRKLRMEAEQLRQDLQQERVLSALKDEELKVKEELIKDMENKMAESAKTIETLNEKLADTQEKLHQTQMELDQTQHKLEKARTKMKEMEAAFAEEKARLEKEMEEMQKAHEAKLAQMDERHKKEMEELRLKFEKEAGELKQKLETAAAEGEALRKDKARLEEELRGLNEQLKAVQKELEQEKEAGGNLKEEMERVKGELQNTLDEQARERQAWLKKEGEMEVEIQQLKREAEERKAGEAGWKQKEKEWNNERTDLQNKNSALQNKNTDLQTEIDSLRNQLHAVSNSNNNSQSKWEEERKKLLQQLADAEKLAASRPKVVEKIVTAPQDDDMVKERSFGFTPAEVEEEPEPEVRERKAMFAQGINEIQDVKAKDEELHRKQVENNWALLVAGLKSKMIQERVARLKAEMDDSDTDTDMKTPSRPPSQPISGSLMPPESRMSQEQAEPDFNKLAEAKQKKRKKKIQFWERFAERQREVEMRLHEMRDEIERERRKNLERVLAAVNLLTLSEFGVAEMREDRPQSRVVKIDSSGTREQDREMFSPGRHMSDTHYSSHGVSPTRTPNPNFYIGDDKTGDQGGTTTARSLRRQYQYDPEQTHKRDLPDPDEDYLATHGSIYRTDPMTRTDGTRTAPAITRRAVVGQRRLIGLDGQTQEYIAQFSQAKESTGQAQGMGGGVMTDARSGRIARGRTRQAEEEKVVEREYNAGSRASQHNDVLSTPVVKTGKFQKTKSEAKNAQRDAVVSRSMTQPMNATNEQTITETRKRATAANTSQKKRPVTPDTTRTPAPLMPKPDFTAGGDGVERERSTTSPIPTPQTDPRVRTAGQTPSIPRFYNTNILRRPATPPSNKAGKGGTKTKTKIEDNLVVPTTVSLVIHEG
ncbi:hypothetical protein BLNAU_4279 [Blattamonas nauphoetae]|uniref:Uncharacterized protein n=1 Tax=Blattamonas nauphoetae TaxID=2049346 RepID=A0ABQ9YAT5_9EUKA|nr:hypothetical protein BLNAU_4279 [Blattamonas nauphoetae]